jgi:hypothetical protein
VQQLLLTDFVAEEVPVVLVLEAHDFVQEVLFWQPVVDFEQQDLVGVVVVVLVLLLSFVVTVVVLVVVDDCACTFTEAAKKNKVVRMMADAKNIFFIFFILFSLTIVFQFDCAKIEKSNEPYRLRSC